MQYGDITEVYNYQKDVHKKTIRTNTRRTKRGAKKNTFHYRGNVKRARSSFFRFVYANLYAKGTPALITLTNFEDVELSLGYEYLRKFSKNCRKISKDFAYISVPEWQKSGRLHFHCLVWGLPEKILKKERQTRFIQRQWARGYVDVLIARDASPRIAGYLAKYMAKAYTDRRLLNRRAYSFSYNIHKWFQAGSNSLSHRLIHILPDDKEVIDEYNYSTQYLGQCVITRYKVKYNGHSKKDSRN